MDSQAIGRSMDQMLGCFFWIMVVGMVAVIGWIVCFTFWMVS